MAEYIQCPTGCGTSIDVEDLDYLYPNNREGTRWTAHCPFCDFSVQGTTMEEADFLFRNQGCK